MMSFHNVGYVGRLGNSGPIYQTAFDDSTGWTLGSGCSIASGKLSITSAQSSARIAYYDLGAGVLPASWRLRFKIILNALTNTATGNAIKYEFGISENNALSGENPAGAGDDSLAFQVAAHAAGSTSNFYALSFGTGGFQYTTGTSRAEPLTLTRWVDLSKTSGQLEAKVYSDAYSTLDETITLGSLTDANYTNLRYLFFRAFAQAVTDANTHDVDDVELIAL